MDNFAKKTAQSRYQSRLKNLVNNKERLKHLFMTVVLGVVGFGAVGLTGGGTGRVGDQLTDADFKAADEKVEAMRKKDAKQLSGGGDPPEETETAVENLLKHSNDNRLVKWIQDFLQSGGSFQG